ncbi:MAG: dockerin type I repeat-containing protein [Bacteroidota bacterium]|nr:dockerin type I repeat-containing protein [Bacteroidota bacterium]
MIKIFSYFAVILFLCISTNSYAQIAGYTFSQSSRTYTVETPAGGPAVIFNTGWDDASSAQPIGFTFNFGGTPYTTATISSNGFLVFAATIGANGSGGAFVSPSNSNGNYLGGTNSNPGIAGCNMDLQEQTYPNFSGATTSGSKVITGVAVNTNLRIGMRLSGNGIPAGSIITSIVADSVTISANATVTAVNPGISPRASIIFTLAGTAPNRTRILQVIDARRFGILGNADHIDFQIRLNEGGGIPANQTIDIVYGTLRTTSAQVNGAQVGIRTTTADFQNRTTATEWNATTAGTFNTDRCNFSNTVIFPVPGLAFTYSPVSPIAAQIKIIIQGFYNISTDRLNIRDTVRAYLRYSLSPYNVIDSAKSVIDSLTFTGSFLFANAPSGIYYIQTRHRNSIETWSKLNGEQYTFGSVLSYDFTDSITKAFGNNMTRKGSNFCIYNGDVNQDGIIDGSDLGIIDNNAYNFVSGYVAADVNGDGIVDISDLVIADDNTFNFISIQRQ